MSKEKDFGKLQRIDKDFEKLIRTIATERIARGKDIKMKGSRRITLAMRRHPLIIDISKDIIEADLDAEGRK